MSYNRFPGSHHVLLDNLREVNRSLKNHCGEVYTLHLNLPQYDRYNNYMDFAISVYLDKFKQLYCSLSYALEREWYLVYAQNGRAIIENAALVRYYSRKDSFSTFFNSFQKNCDTEDEYKNAILDLDKFVRGSRFSWDAFVEGRFEDLDKKPEFPELKQVNITTCLEHWYKEEKKLKSLYGQLCELVHPNLGSNLLIIRSLDSELVASGHAGQFVSQFIIFPTLAGIVGAYMEIQYSVQKLSKLRLRKE